MLLRHVDAILWHKVGLSDFKGIHEINKNRGGSSQTYFQAAGYSKEDLDEFFRYSDEALDTDKKWPSGDPKKKYIISATAIGTRKTKTIEFDPRGGKKTTRTDYKISKQTPKDRHPAWRPEAGFPELPMQKASDGTKKYIFDESSHATLYKNLRIFVIRTRAETGEHKYFAAFTDTEILPIAWPANIGLERIFNASKQHINGILFLKDSTIRFSNSKDCPFSIGSAADKEIGAVELPEDIDEISEDAVEFALSAIKEFDVSDLSKVSISTVDRPVSNVRKSRHNDKENSPRSRIGKKTDYGTRQKNLKKIGDLGEKLAVEYEKRRLNSEGRSDLAELVQHIPPTQGDGLGYDILSFEKMDSGEYGEKYIEVKATTGGITKPFDITANEVEVSAEKGKQYVIYRFYSLHNEMKEAKFYEVRGAVREHFSLEPTAYRAQIK